MRQIDPDRGERVLEHQLGPEDVHVRVLEHDYHWDPLDDDMCEEACGIVELPWGSDVAWHAWRAESDGWRIWIPRHGGAVADVEVVLCEERAAIEQALRELAPPRAGASGSGSGCCLVRSAW